MRSMLFATVGLVALSFVPTASAAFVIDGGFETPTIATNSYAYEPTLAAGGYTNGSPWTFSTTNSGIVNGTGSGFNPTGPAPAAGAQFAFIQGAQGTGGTISQSVSFTTGGTFTISLLDASRVGYNQGSFTISLDGVVVGGDAPLTSSTFSTYTTATFAETAGTHTLTFTAVPVGFTDTSSFIDSVSVNQIGTAVPEPASMVMMGLGLVISGAAYARRKLSNRTV